ncbi:MAG: hypothetical protein VKK62_08190 [Synechococcaceae cyanobacterium]|nr:hypothetical protein [Synechococcaceae cyanobacterium]
MRVSHLAEHHLLLLTSEEVALLLDLIHAGAISDELGGDASTHQAVEALVGRLQDCLFSTAQDVWRRERSLEGEAASIAG